MMMSTPFAFDIVESSMRIMVDGDDIRVVFSKDLQREPLSLSCVMQAHLILSATSCASSCLLSLEHLRCHFSVRPSVGRWP